jgi:predicted O-methyltransferase YrrM
MSDSRWTLVDLYLDDQLSLSDPVLDQVLAASQSEGLPEIQVAPALGRLLNLIARIHQSGSILEIGTLGGYSTICLARALPEGGRLVTLELEEHHARVARQNVERAGLAARVDIKVGPAEHSLQLLHQQQADPFDLIFVDVDKAGYRSYLEWALKLSRPGTVIILDNVVRDGAVTDAQSDDESVVGVRQMFDAIREDPRVSATAIQTVGCKGYDGFCLAIVE